MSKSEIDRILKVLDEMRKDISKMFASIANNSKDIVGLSQKNYELEQKFNNCRMDEDVKISKLTTFQNDEQIKNKEKNFLLRHWKLILIVSGIIALAGIGIFLGIISLAHDPAIQEIAKAYNAVRR